QAPNTTVLRLFNGRPGMPTPEGPKSMSLYRVCCAASRTGTASAANNVNAAIHINVLDFIVPPLHEGWESSGRILATADRRSAATNGPQDNSNHKAVALRASVQAETYETPLVVVRSTGNRRHPEAQQTGSI